MNMNEKLANYYRGYSVDEALFGERPKFPSIRDDDQDDYAVGFGMLSEDFED